MSEYKHTVKTACKFCRKAFNSFGLSKVCPDCDTHMDRWFLAIKTYLDENPNAVIAEICNDLGIPAALIKYYLKEERLEIKNSERNYFLKCEKCKKAISTGRLCFECQIIVTRAEMQAVLVHNPENENMDKEIAKFHTKKLYNR